MRTNTAIDDELGVLRRLSGAAQSATSRLAWRMAMQRRCTRIAVTVRVLPLVLRRRPFMRTKVRHMGWEVRADGDVVLVISSYSPARTLGQLLEPIAVRVERAGGLDLAPLLRLEARGHITLEEISP